MANKKRYTDDELRERKRARNRDYYIKNRERLLKDKQERNRTYYQNHRDIIATRSLDRYYNNKVKNT